MPRHVVETFKQSSVSDDGPPEPPFGGRRGTQLTADDLRNFFMELAGVIAR